ncbi:uncharacterized protein LOC106870796 isoform X1 [Octopus bimaculoides]|uniref:uncharacterized protein LOC106870796 isoform X1 n=1 Tax=Octopus bimaculoides TaxID=37653 RepID=UPI0022E3D22D|nr:uncharacterized protein LOC106870796 isoform X1 [Octopus bimaculoides]
MGQFLLDSGTKILVIVVAIYCARMVQQGQKQTFVDTSTPEYIGRIKFPGYFRTEEEQKTWEKIIYGHKIDSVCCNGKSIWKTPEKMRDINGTERDIVQFTKLRQFYREVECTQAVEYEKVTCEMEKALCSLVYQYNETESEVQYAVGMFDYTCCCVCIDIK